jgi:biotin operon repressor
VLLVPLLLPAAPSVTAASSGGAGPSQAAGGASRGLVALPGSALPAAALVLPRAGQLAPASTLQVGLTLRPRDAEGLARYAAAVSTPSSATFHRFLSPAELAQRFGPSESTVRAAVRVLRADGLRVGTVPADRLLVPATGTAADVEAAFHVGLSKVRLPSGALGWSAVGTPLVPAVIGRSVAAVVGLDQLAQAQALGRTALSGTSPRSARPLVAGSGSGGSVQAAIAGSNASTPGLPVPCRAALATAVGSGGWTDDAIANAYGFAPLLAHGDLGAGETLAVYELEPFSASDVDAFDRCYFGRSKPAQLHVVRVDGFGYRGAGVGESILDIEDLSALAPDAKILVYEAPNTEYGQVDEYNAIVSQDRANIVTTSWAECETQAEVEAPGMLQLENVLFEEAAAEGQTMLAAAGDTGSDSCASTQFGSTAPAAPYLSVDDPASQPYVLGVGGVSLKSVADPPVQSAWNDGPDSGGGGGGLSNTWLSPSWQSGSGIPGTGLRRRQVPDVSASADEFRGTTIFSSAFAPAPVGDASGAPPGSSPAATAPASARAADAPARAGASASDPAGGWTVIGGTSSAAPQWAAALALVADSSSCASLPRTRGGPDLGFVAPELYDVASDPSAYDASFTDVTSGNNDVFHLGRGYAAGPGYNMATGLGTPMLAGPSGQPGLAANLCAIASGKPARGAAVPTITGVSPSSGPLGGGGTVTLTGSGFAAASAGSLRVLFGLVAASVQSVEPAAITVTVPRSRRPAGSSPFAAAVSVDVSVTQTAGGSELTSLPSPGARYQYVATSPSGAPVPTVTGLTPQGGVKSGGNEVTVYGSGFTIAGGVTSVRFGGVPATFRVVNDSELIATAPAEGRTTSCGTGAGFDPGNDCQVEVVVSDSAGPGAAAPIRPAYSGAIVYDAAGLMRGRRGFETVESATEYDYSGPPRISSISPDPAGYASSAPVTIHGRNFNVLTLEWVDFGPVTSTASQQVKFTYVSPTEISIVPPPAPASPGAAPEALPGGVTVQSLSGTSNTAPFAYSTKAGSRT